MVVDADSFIFVVIEFAYCAYPRFCSRTFYLYSFLVDIYKKGANLTVSNASGTNNTFSFERTFAFGANMNLKSFQAFLRVTTLISVVLLAVACGGGGGGDGKNGSGDDCTSSSTCPIGEFCKFEDFSCGASGLVGACRTIPIVDCNLPAVDPEPTDIVGQVCSCDRLTFNNQCWAEAASQSIVGAGECP